MEFDAAAPQPTFPNLLCSRAFSPTINPHPPQVGSTKLLPTPLKFRTTPVPHIATLAATIWTGLNPHAAGGIDSRLANPAISALYNMGTAAPHPGRVRPSISGAFRSGRSVSTLFWMHYSPCLASFACMHARALCRGVFFVRRRRPPNQRETYAHPSIAHSHALIYVPLPCLPASPLPPPSPPSRRHQ